MSVLEVKSVVAVHGGSQNRLVAVGDKVEVEDQQVHFTRSGGNFSAPITRNSEGFTFERQGNGLRGGGSTTIVFTIDGVEQRVLAGFIGHRRSPDAGDDDDDTDVFVAVATGNV